MPQTIISRQRESNPRYPSIVPAVLWALFNRQLGRHLSFGTLARRLNSRVSLPVVSHGTQNIPIGGGYVVTVNHYAREGFSSAWIAIALSALISTEVTWVMTDEWVFEGNPLAFALRPVMRFVLRSLHAVFGFLPMPTMAPGYSDTAQRAAAVRRVIEYVRTHPGAVIGLSPEGRDALQPGMGELPAGVGKFILYLNRMGLRILPVGITEVNGQLAVRFGEPYDLALADAEGDLDGQVRTIVREQISRLIEPVSSDS